MSVRHYPHFLGNFRHLFPNSYISAVNNSTPAVTIRNQKGVIFMGLTDDLKQKISGETDKLKGSFEEARGNNLEGKMKKIKGKIKSGIADAKLKNRNTR